MAVKLYGWEGNRRQCDKDEHYSLGLALLIIKRQYRNASNRQDAIRSSARVSSCKKQFQALAAHLIRKV